MNFLPRNAIETDLLLFAPFVCNRQHLWSIPKAISFWKYFFIYKCELQKVIFFMLALLYSSHILCAITCVKNITLKKKYRRFKGGWERVCSRLNTVDEGAIRSSRYFLCKLMNFKRWLFHAINSSSTHGNGVCEMLKSFYDENLGLNLKLFFSRTFLQQTFLKIVEKVLLSFWLLLLSSQDNLEKFMISPLCLFYSFHTVNNRTLRALRLYPLFIDMLFCYQMWHTEKIYDKSDQ